MPSRTHLHFKYPSYLCSFQYIYSITRGITQWAITICVISLLTSCSRYPSSLEDCPWQVEFPEQPEIQSIFEGKVVRKQRAQVKQNDKIYRTSCTLWKKNKRKEKETDERWIHRIERLMKLNLLYVDTQQFSEYSVTKITASQNCPGPECRHYWLHSYFDGHARFALIYRQPSSKLDIRGRVFLKSVKRKTISNL